MKGQRRDDEEEDELTSCDAARGFCTAGGRINGFTAPKDVDLPGGGGRSKGFLVLISLSICGCGGRLKVLGDF